MRLMRPATKLRRITVGVAGAVTAISVAWLFAHVASQLRPAEFVAADFTQLWRAGEALLAGRNPYEVVTSSERAYPFRDALGYPMPAVLIALPFVLLSPIDAAWFWCVLGVATFIVACLYRRREWLGMLLSPCLLTAVVLVQWSPLLVAGILLPPLAVLYAAKPTIGLALLAGWPSRWAVLGGLALGLVALLLVPTWPADWLAAASSTSQFYVAPATIWQGGGPLLLLAWLRWRQPEARLLGVLALVPHNLVLYDQFVLVATCRRWWEVALLVAGSWLAFVWGGEARTASMDAFTQHAALRVPVLIGCYLPALVIVLLRRNEGAPPRQVAKHLDSRELPE